VNFPSYSDLVVTVATLAFLFCYVVALAVQVWSSQKKAGGFALTHVAIALVVALCGSILSFLAIYFFFRSA
jgi:hypothetical protein